MNRLQHILKFFDSLAKCIEFTKDVVFTVRRNDVDVIITNGQFVHLYIFPVAEPVGLLTHWKNWQKKSPSGENIP